MIHFLYLIGFAFFVAIAFGAFASGTSKEKIIYGSKNFRSICRYKFGFGLDFLFSSLVIENGFS